MKLKIAYSPCPNDTFAFHAMVHSLIDCEGLSFETTLPDIENLNKSAGKGLYDVCKLSYSAFFKNIDRYVMLHCGSALGFNNGPLLVAKKGASVFLPNGNINEEEVVNGKVAIPGDLTTAALLLKFAYPGIRNTTPILFSHIEEQILAGRFDSGVLIHETRFTYEKKGLILVKDLGNFWQEQHLLPIPLGGVAVLREMEVGLQRKIERVLRRSIEYALKFPQQSSQYVGYHAREMDSAIQRQHIKMFVNNETLNLSALGEKAVNRLFQISKGEFLTDSSEKNIFIL